MASPNVVLASPQHGWHVDALTQGQQYKRPCIIVVVVVVVVRRGMKECQLWLLDAYMGNIPLAYILSIGQAISNIHTLHVGVLFLLCTSFFGVSSPVRHVF
jgi:hypothetical protein